MFGNPLHHWCQRGAIIVFTALLLPLLMACTGLAVDLGNLYVHKARLQNAADAAALAGAREFAVKGEAVDAHPQADVEASLYVDTDAQNRNIANAITGRLYRAKEVDDAIYYRVDLTENVPLYFLRIFGLMDSDVSAASVASIGMVEESGGGNGDGENLFIFKKFLEITNSIENPGSDATKDDDPGTIRSTFTGNVRYTEGSGENRPDYKYDSLMYGQGGLDCFFTEDAIGMSRNAARNANYTHKVSYTQYNMDDVKQKVKRALGLPEEDVSKPEWKGDWRQYQADAEAYKNYTKNFTINKKNYSTADFFNSIAIAADPNNGDGNIDNIEIHSLGGDESSSPVYIYLDESINQNVNVKFYGDVGRPVILCYLGPSNLTVDFSSENGKTPKFNGVIYAPNATQCLIHDKNLTFSGSIIANGLKIDEGPSRYKYKDFLGDDSGSSGSGSDSTKKTVKSTSKINLVSSSGISWD